MTPVFLSLAEVLEIHRDQIERYGGYAGRRPALNVLLFLICHGLCHPLPPKITALRVDLKIRGALPSFTGP